MDQVWNAISALVRPLLTLSYLISVHALTAVELSLLWFLAA